jgi:hypothetical protein
LSDLNETTGLVPPRLQLGSLRGVRKEMARVYQAALAGEIEPHQATRLAYVLKEIRACLEAESLTRLEARLAEITSRGAIPNGRASYPAPARAWN